MFELVYVVFFFLMLGEMLLFFFLNLPIFKAWKAGAFERLIDSKKVHVILKIQLVLCLIIVLFFVDLHRTERLFGKEKNKLKLKTTMGAEVRRERLSYQVIKIQRNKYISFLVLFTFLANVVYFWLKHKRYQLEQQYMELGKSHKDLVKRQSKSFFD